MKPGDLVKYWFARRYPITGLVVRKWEYELKPNSEGILPWGTYIFSVEILENNGALSVFDIHVGDDWRVIREAR